MYPVQPIRHSETCTSHDHTSSQKPGGPASRSSFFSLPLLCILQKIPTFLDWAFHALIVPQAAIVFCSRQHRTTLSVMRTSTVPPFIKGLDFAEETVVRDAVGSAHQNISSWNPVVSYTIAGPHAIYDTHGTLVPASTAQWRSWRGLLLLKHGCQPYWYMQISPMKEIGPKNGRAATFTPSKRPVDRGAQVQLVS